MINIQLMIQQQFKEVTIHLELLHGRTKYFHIKCLLARLRTNLISIFKLTLKLATANFWYKQKLQQPIVTNPKRTSFFYYIGNLCSLINLSQSQVSRKVLDENMVVNEKVEKVLKPLIMLHK